MAPDVHVSHLAPPGELELASRAQVDPLAPARLFDEYLPRVYAFVARRVEDRAAAEELTAATMQRALQAVRHVDGPALQFATEFVVVVAGDAQGAAGRDHIHDQAQHLRRLRPAVHQVADEDRLSALRVSVRPASPDGILTVE